MGKKSFDFNLKCKKYSTQIHTSSRCKCKLFNMVDIWPLTYENMWLPVEIWYDLKFLWKDRLGRKSQFWVPLQHIYELIGHYIPIFPLTLHWNQKYQKAQVTISVNLHLKPLSLTFPRRQEQCPRNSIDSLNNRCPWLNWQMILKWHVHFVPKMHWKCTWPKNMVILNFE